MVRYNRENPINNTQGVIALKSISRPLERSNAPCTFLYRRLKMTDIDFKEKLIKVLNDICEELIKIEEAIYDTLGKSR